MKISTRSEYASKALLFLAIAAENGSDRKPKQIPDIAQCCAIPLKYLEQILVVLRNHGILGSRRGVSGGYFLLRTPDSITMGDVVRLMDGACSIAGNLPNCGASDPICYAIRSVWNEVDSAVSAALDKVTFANLRDRAKALEATRDAEIMFYI